MKKSISIIIPTYNEEKGIEKVINSIRDKMSSSQFNYEIIVVDDCSSDRTREILGGIRDIRVITHSCNKGYGAAIKSGVSLAVNDYVAIIDADGTYEADDLIKLINGLENYDMVVGSRSGEVVRVPFLRKPAKWMLTSLANYLTGVKIPDLNSGLRIMKKEIINRFLNILPNGFSFTTTITLAMLTNGYNVKYYPINYQFRKGKSKIRPIADTLNFIQLIIRTVLYFDPLKIFLPMSFFLFAAGLILLFYRIFVARMLVSTITILFIASFQILAIGMLADLIDKRIKD